MKLTTGMISSVILSPLLAASGFCFALPFNVFPKVTLPTQVQEGQSVSALYTVQNNTGSVRMNNFVKYLPPNVGQVFVNPAYTNLCGPLFNLAAKGMPGDSCTLELQVTGRVNRNDPDPHHHLFICFPGGKTCAGTLFPLDVTITSNPNPTPKPRNLLRLTTVGFSSFQGSNVSPLAYTTSDSGLNWTLSPPFSLPVGQTEASLNGVSCVGDLCSTVGGASGGPNSEPVAYTSTDLGKNWVISPLPFTLPGLQTDAALRAVSCTGTSCTSVGTAFGGTPQEALVYTSNDSGINWLLSAPLPLPGGQTSSDLTSITCEGSACSAVGLAFGGPTLDPLAYTSNDGGITWTLSLSTPLPLPAGQTDGLLSGVTCIGLNCATVGQSFALTSLPLVYTSTNGGVNWTLSPPLSLPVGAINAGLNSIACVGSACSAVGSYSTPVARPLAYTSNDGGINWVLSPPFVLPTGLTGNAALNGVICIDSDCIAVGTASIPGSDTFPLAYSSSDLGKNWVLTSSFILPVGQSSGELRSVSGSAAGFVKKFGLKNAANIFLDRKKI